MPCSVYIFLRNVDVRSARLVEFLTAQEADVNARDGEGRTTLRAAIDEYNEEAAELVRSYGGKE